MSKPNIILIMTDQQRFDTISALGAEKYITPNLDRLAREGMIFDNCFCVSPTCMPSRAALLGVYLHSNSALKTREKLGASFMQATDVIDNLSLEFKILEE